jgi:hypothetical protein
MLWIDSPVGTGYSYVNNPSGYATNERTIAEELYTALYTFFFELHPEYSKLPFYIFGKTVYVSDWIEFVLLFSLSLSLSLSLSQINSMECFFSSR